MLLLFPLIVGASGCATRPGRLPQSQPGDYSLHVRVLPDDRRLEVSGTIRIPPADTARPEIRFALSDRVSNLHIEVTQPEGGGELQRGAEKPGAAGVRTNTRWIFRLRRPIPAGQAATLRFSYVESGKIGFLYYVGPEVAFASSWGDNWYPDVDGAVGGTGELTVVVPRGWTVATGGVRRSSPEEEARGVFRSSLHQPRGSRSPSPYWTYLTFSAGKYTVVRHPGAVPLSAYLLTPRSHVDTYLTGASEMISGLVAEFGPFPFEELALVEVPRELARSAGFNAFSPPGMLVLNSRAFDLPDARRSLEWLGHEMSHQWFPHSVSLRVPPGRYIEEALAEYGGLRLVETIGGPAAARQMRTSGYQYDPIYSAAAYFTLVGEGVDHPIDDLDPSLPHRNLAYNKGSLVFDMLSREIGIAAFQKNLHAITRGRRFDNISWNDFLKAITATPDGRNLDWFVEQWVRRTGAPDFRLSWSQDGDTVKGTITQTPPYYRAHLKIELRGGAGEVVDPVFEVSGAKTEFAVRPGFRAQSAVLDPDYEVLRWTPEYRAMADSVRLQRAAAPAPAR